VPAIVTILVAVSALFGRAGIRDVMTSQSVNGLRLVLPPEYVALSPLNRTLDLICLLSVPQHVALLLSVAALFAVWRAFRTGSADIRWLRREAVAAAALLLGAALIYAFAIAGPRPMAALAVDEVELVRVDLHSHTNVSGDARRSFDPMRNREWHTSAGYDLAYVTDHRRFRGARMAAAANPLRAGDGFVALMGFEGRIGGVDVVVPGMTPADSSMIGVRQRLHLDTLASGQEPVVIATIPVRNVERIDTIAGIEGAFVRAIEIVDGAPRGLLQQQKEGSRLRAIADQHRLLLVAGSNTHGWGRTAVAWNVIRVPGWRLLSPDSLGALIEDVLRRRDSGRIQVIERVRPWAGTNPVRLSVTLPVAMWQTLTILTQAERIVWILWAWLAGLLTLLRRRSRSDSIYRTSP
jgi:predicted metal-dependent phosphoesterase TrpH